MSLVITEEQNFYDIADAIRYKRGEDNLLDYSAVSSENKYINSTNGKAVAPSSTNYRYSPFIEVDGGTTYYFHISTAHTGTTAGLAWYTTNSETSSYVSGVTFNALKNNDWTATAPATANYVRFCWRIDSGYDPNWETDVYMCKGTGAPPLYKASQMAEAIRTIAPSGIGTIEISANGLFNVNEYKSASVNVPIDPYVGRYISESTFTTFEDPSMTTIPYGAFAYTRQLTTVSFPEATTIGSYAFGYCFKLSIASFPKVKTISGYAFQYCSSLRSGGLIDSTLFPSLTGALGGYVFRGCQYLTGVSLPNVTSVGAQAFSACSRITTVDLSAAVTLAAGAFSTCTKITSYSLPEVTTINGYTFYSNNALTTLTLPKLTTIAGSYCFRYCSKLMSLYLPGSTIPTVAAANAFANMPFSVSVNNVYGSIYVPSSMVDSYKAATVWTTYKNRIVAIPE